MALEAVRERGVPSYSIVSGEPSAPSAAFSPPIVSAERSTAPPTSAPRPIRRRSYWAEPAVIVTSKTPAGFRTRQPGEEDSGPHIL